VEFTEPKNLFLPFFFKYPTVLVILKTNKAGMKNLSPIFDSV